MRRFLSFPVLPALILGAACSSKPTSSDPVPVASLQLSTSSGTVAVGQSVTLAATPRDADGDPLTGRSIAWSTANAAIATVSNGVVTGVAVGGPVAITATSEGKSATAQLTVTAVPVASITVTPGTASVVAGTTTSLTATARDGSGNALPGRVMAWNSGNPAVATVSDGVVTGVTPGTATITATSEGKNATAQVTVTAVPVASVTISGGTSVEAGQTIALAAVARDAANNTLTGRSVTWESSSIALATVSGTGVVTGVAAGAVTITARVEGIAGTKALTVTAAPTPVWTMSDELRIGGSLLKSGSGITVAGDGRAIAVHGTDITERSAGGTWGNPVTIPGTASLYAGTVDPNGMFWAVGMNGLIAKRTASGWVAEASGVTESVQDIAMRGDGHGFAVGLGMVLERSTAGVWTRSTLLTGYSVTAVGTPTATFALAIGSGGNGVGSSARWNGSAWTEVPFTGALLNFRPNYLLVVSPTEAYASGIIGTNLLSARYTIAEWNGTTWTVGFQRAGGEVYPYPTGGITRCADGSIYTGLRYGAIYRKQGGAWSEWTPNGITVADGFVLACDSDNAMLLGSLDGLLMRSTNGTTWTMLRWRPSLSAIAIGTPTRVFGSSRNAVATTSGGAWTRTAIPLPNGAPVIVPTAMWAQGNDALVSGNPAGRFNGTAWTWTPVSPAVGGGGMWGTSITQVFAVGTLSRMDSYNGGGWSALTDLFGGVWNLDQIHGSGSILVAGSSSYGVVRFNGTAWSQFTAPPGGLGILRVLPGGTIYNVNVGRLQQWTGTAWVDIGCSSNCFGTPPAAVAARALDEIYAFENAAGTVRVHRFNGTGWQMIQTFPGRITAATWAGNQGIAVGDDGLVLRANTNFGIRAPQ